MISGILVYNQKGEQIIGRYYRADVPSSTIQAFRTQVIASKETGSRPPIIHMDNASFMLIRHGAMHVVAVTRLNANALCVFEFLLQVVRILKAYLGETFDEDTVRNNITLLFELFDEVMDYGYPQNCSVDVLRLYINLGQVQAIEEEKEAQQLTSQITGAIDWRREGIRYRKNEVYIDVLESVNLLMSTNGTILRNEVSGQVIMKAFLTGMPECKFGLNDKLIMDKESGSAQARSGRKIAGVEIDDCTFHRCVRLGKFDAERTITFIPPDGEFELMRYRVRDTVHLPFRIVPAVQEESRSKASVNLKIHSNFDDKAFANNVVIKIPTPPNTARVRINTARGRARYEPEQRAIVWRIRRFPAATEYMLTADIDMVTSMRDKPWVRPPISLEFQVPMFAASGVHVRFLKVYDKSGYQTQRWVRYITRAGEYSIRI